MKRYPNGDPIARRDFKAAEYLRKTEDPSMCGNPACARKQPMPHAHRECKAGDPNLCDCVCEKSKEMHGSILLHIKQIESLNLRLKISFGVTQQLREQTSGVKKPVDQSVPCEGMRSELENMMETINELSLGDQK